MARIDPIPFDDLPERAELFAIIEAHMGFVPSSMPTMEKMPGLLDAFSGLAGTVLNTDLLDRGLVQMIAFMASAGAGCRYCQAHTTAHAAKAGVPDDKLADLWSFETSEHFDDAERTALRLAFHSGQQPNAATEADFDACRQHWSEPQVTAIVAVCSLFGFLNRWNDTMATTLEAEPRAVAESLLAPGGWEPGKHA